MHLKLLYIKPSLIEAHLRLHPLIHARGFPFPFILSIPSSHLHQLIENPFKKSPYNTPHSYFIIILLVYSWIWFILSIFFVFFRKVSLYFKKIVRHLTFVCIVRQDSLGEKLTFNVGFFDWELEEQEVTDGNLRLLFLVMHVFHVCGKTKGKTKMKSSKRDLN